MYEIIQLMFVIAFIIDYSGVVNTISEFLWNKIFKNVSYNGWTIPLFSCVLCSTWWGVGFYCLFNDYGLINSFFIGGVSAYLNQFTVMIMYKLRDIIIKIIN